ncbi:ATP-binding cassette domain-containing protein, partial [Rhizobium ruizarguesonis]
MSQQALLEIRNLSIDFPNRTGIVHAVNDVSWSINPGQTLAILGESGSGKSVSASAVLDLVDSPPAVIASGQILYRGQDLLKSSKEERRAINGKKISMIFQDPLAALNPVYPVGWQIAETLRVHGVDKATAHARVIDLLARVGIEEPERRARQYPHQFSGGQRQRIMIASAIALEPDLLIADEPTSALDVTVQAQVLALLKKLQSESGMGIVLITHDLSVVEKVADRVVVMQDGRIVESGTSQQIMTSPQHPYTRKLLDAMPGRHGFDATQEAAIHGRTLLEVDNVSRIYGIRPGKVAEAGPNAIRAVNEASFVLKSGETLGIVGESGSGKSTL